MQKNSKVKQKTNKNNPQPYFTRYNKVGMLETRLKDRILMISFVHFLVCYLLVLLGCFWWVLGRELNGHEVLSCFFFKLGPPPITVFFWVKVDWKPHEFDNQSAPFICWQFLWLEITVRSMLHLTKGGGYFYFLLILSDSYLFFFGSFSGSSNLLDGMVSLGAERDPSQKWRLVGPAMVLHHECCVVMA